MIENVIDYLFLFCANFPEVALQQTAKEITTHLSKRATNVHINARSHLAI